MNLTNGTETNETDTGDTTDVPYYQTTTLYNNTTINNYTTGMYTDLFTTTPPPVRTKREVITKSKAFDFSCHGYLLISRDRLNSFTMISFTGRRGVEI